MVRPARYPPWCRRLVHGSSADSHLITSGELSLTRRVPGDAGPQCGSVGGLAGRLGWRRFAKRGKRLTGGCI